MHYYIVLGQFSTVLFFQDQHRHSNWNSTWSDSKEVARLTIISWVTQQWQLFSEPKSLDLLWQAPYRRAPFCFCFC